MKDRIELILESYQLSPSRFADELGIQRSGISHIMSGRNKPSLELIQKILNKFPDLNSDWLVQGTGPMKKEPMDPNQIKLFDELEVAEVEKPIDRDVFKSREEPVALKNEFRITAPEKPPVIESPTTSIPEQEVRQAPQFYASPELKQQAAPKHASVKTIEKIMVFYSDKTFSEYRPE